MTDTDDIQTDDTTSDSVDLSNPVARAIVSTEKPETQPQFAPTADPDETVGRVREFVRQHAIAGRSFDTMATNYKKVYPEGLRYASQPPVAELCLADLGWIIPARPRRRKFPAAIRLFELYCRCVSAIQRAAFVDGTIRGKLTDHLSVLSHSVNQRPAFTYQVSGY